MDNQITKDGLPTGTVTFLFTDIEGSTRHWEEHPQPMHTAFARQEAILREAIAANGGSAYKMIGDAFQAAFATASDALKAAIEAQRALEAEDWDSIFHTPHSAVRVRMALHTGVTEEREGDYVGPLLNRVARLLSAGHGGQVLLTDATATLLLGALPPDVTLRDLGQHRLKDLTRAETIYQAVTADLPLDFPPLNTLDARPNNLPIQTTPFIGREKQVEALESLLSQPQIRLITLTGTAGTGKTRLALQVAAGLLENFQDGAFFISLAQLKDPDQVAATIAQALGVAEHAGQPLAASISLYMRDKELLLLIDNFEQVLEAVPLVRELLQASTGLKAMVTSREVLHLYGEKEFPVPPLNVPDLQQLPPLEQLAQYEAIRLFVDRAMLAKPDFSITKENARAVAGVCCRLDGLPLAIELAAARIKLLPPQAMLARLSNRLSLLTGGARDLPARHQTLRGAIEWSYDLLSEAEQMLFTRMSVFAGGCTLEAADVVCKAVPGLEIDVLDGFSSLMDKSLVSQQEVTDEPRFSILETIREFGTERLVASGQTEAIERAHANFYLDMAEQGRQLRTAGGDRLSLSRLHAELDNLRATLAWSLRNDTDVALRFCTSLPTYFWYIHGLLAEGRRWIEQAIELPDASQKASYAAAILALSAILGFQGEPTAARERFQQALSLVHGDQSEWLVDQVNGTLAIVISMQGDPQVALDTAQQVVELTREVGDEFNLAEALTASGVARIFLGDYLAATQELEESLALFKKQGNTIGIARSSSALGDLARIAGDYAEARGYYNAAMALSRERGARGAVASFIHNFGHLVLVDGDDAQAKKLFAESLALHMQTEDTGGIAEALAGFAAVARARKQPERAARLLAAATGIWEANNISIWPAEKVEYERNLAAARSQLDDESWEKAWQEGLAMTMEQAIAYGREEASAD